MNCVGTPKEGEEDLEEFYVGNSAEALRGRLNLRYPMEHGIVQDWDDVEKIWEHIFFEGLDVDPENQPVLLTEAPLNPLKNREKMAEIMFETFGVPALNIALQAVLALYASGRTTGVVLDCGEGVTHVVPVVEGYAIPRAIHRLDMAGRDLTGRLLTLLADKGYELEDDASTMEAVKDLKEKACRVALDYETELGSVEPQTYEMSNGMSVDLGPETLSVPEVLFNPSMIGFEKATAFGLPKLIYETIQKTEIDLRRELYENIILSGGSTMFPGLTERLTHDLTELIPEAVRVRIIAPPERAYSVWIGGSISADLAQQTWVTAFDYSESGPEILHRNAADGRHTLGI